MNKKYIPKIAPIEAVQWTGDNLNEVKGLLGSAYVETINFTDGDCWVVFQFDPNSPSNHHKQSAKMKYWIIELEEGRFTSMHPDIFTKSYTEST